MSNPRASSPAPRLPDKTSEEQAEPKKGLFDALHREIDAIFGGLSSLAPPTSETTSEDPEALLAAIVDMRRELDALEFIIRKRAKRPIPPAPAKPVARRDTATGGDPDWDWWQTSYAPAPQGEQPEPDLRRSPSLEPIAARARAQLRKDLGELYKGYAAPGDTQDLPSTAPELWSNRTGRRENPIAFIRRVYRPWLGHGLTRAHIRRLDLPLYRALSVWLTRHPGETMPELPSRSESIDRTVETLADDISPEQLRRLGLALQSRKRSSK